MTATLRFEDKIAVLDLGEDENRFSPDWLGSVDKLLDQALSEGAHALVTTATGKFYSNGLDLDWLGANGDKAKWYVQQVQSLFARMLTFPMPTVAAINGHAFGAGAMLGIAHDYRVMRDDRGYYCFPEGGHQHPLHRRNGSSHPGQTQPGVGNRRHDHGAAIRRK